MVLHVLYLIFNEGYTASSGPDLQRADLTAEAIRLARDLHRLLPDDGEVAGLLALMLLTDARRPARTLPDGSLVPLAEQDRRSGTRPRSTRASRSSPRRWRAPRSGRTSSRRRSPRSTTRRPGPTTRTGARSSSSTSCWPASRPTRWSRSTRPSRSRWSTDRAAGLDLLATLDADERMAGHHRLDAVRAHLLEMAGDSVAARASYRAAARRTTSVPEQRYLEARAARLVDVEP